LSKNAPKLTYDLHLQIQSFLLGDTPHPRQGGGGKGRGREGEGENVGGGR